MNKIVGIQYLRGIAALLVVFYHSIGKFEPEKGMYYFGAEGVDIFFIISGFLMALITSKNVDENKLKQAFIFVKKRFIRIVPLYWIALLWTYKRELVSDGPPSYFAHDFLFFPRFYDSEIGAIWPELVVGWTLNYEAFFYVIVALSIVFSPKRHVATVFAIVTLVLLGLIYEPSSTPGIFYTSTILLEFLLGVLIYYISKKLITHSKLPYAILMLVSSIVLYQQNLPLPRFIVDGIPAAIVVLSAIKLFENTNFRSLEILGNGSYSIYLFHLIVFSLFDKVLFQFKVNQDMFPLWINAMTYTVVGIVGGLVIYVALEKRLLKYLQSKFISNHQAA